VIATRVSRFFEGSLQRYVYWKVRMDPAYEAVLAHLRAHPGHPVVDIGCGAGVLALYLRESGFTAPIVGIDFDERKIAAARTAAGHHRDLEFRCADAADPLPAGHSVVLLDVLQYVDSAAQERILRNIAAVVPPGGVVVIRQGIRDGSWRYHFTRLVDAIGRAIRWNRGRRINFPTREQITSAFAGFEADVSPLWGRTPYNNYLLVFTKPSRGE
jgi:SAM-dependent methyltransferase